MSDNPIQRLLDDRGVPWRESEAALAERFGVGHDPLTGRRGVVLVETHQPFLPKLIRPLSFGVSAPGGRSVPPARFEGSAFDRTGLWWRSRAIASLEYVISSLEPALGPPRRSATSNSRDANWRFGPSSIRLYCFPPGLWPFGPLNSRKRRYLKSCSIEIETGYRPLCSAVERNWIDALTPAMQIGDRRGGRLGETAPPHAVLEFVREPVPEARRLTGTIGRTDDGKHVILVTDQLYVIPWEDILHVHLECAWPGRGGGYSSLGLEVQLAGLQWPRRVPVSNGREVDSLNEEAERLAAWLDKKLETEAHPDE